jgi:hypothetical protein
LAYFWHTNQILQPPLLGRKLISEYANHATFWSSSFLMYLTGSQETLSSISFHSELNPNRAAHCSI